jgi:hypothetical protein
MLVAYCSNYCSISSIFEDRHYWENPQISQIYARRRGSPSTTIQRWRAEGKVLGRRPNM